ncbi:uncharacterized protein MYCFIDRAFT_213783 [Pseudocercospora fijiensis CIRAD86]|uniref:CAP-Gly domain-containing protein n=1 Tax=Pseudocercospora fijiensis (strain CIRAD86) TaxID=383855 RepID=N1QA05_PSEFD|nr:uncharacterized protein MYCFIDRAFT_213783 [Pseudocercospora fijiensis CIRAD86]EME89755.1 hypothetical protein MYCFIDRAFT_213783 [Pseudocercospora fijiensis CIRAD86]
MSNISLAVGQTVELNDSRSGIVRFVGPTQFQTGEWVGVELGDASGKNDGSVQGQRYFDCPPRHGIFCRPSGISRVVEEAKLKAKPAGNGAPVKARPSSVHTALNGTRRQTLTQAGAGPGKRASTTSDSPTPAPRVATGIRSPAKSPTKQLGTNGTSSASTSRTSTPPVAGRKATATAAAKPRSSLAPATSTAARRTSTLPSAPASRTTASTTSTTSTRSGLSRPAIGTAAASRLAPAARARATTKDRLSSTTEESTNDSASEAASTRESITSSRPGTEAGEEDIDDTITNFAPPAPPPIPPEPAERIARARRPSSPGAASIHSQRTIRSTAQTNRQIEELEAKLRQLERKGAENRELKLELEKAQQERDSARSIIEKLQNKYRPVQEENQKMKKEIAEYETRISSVEQMQAEHEAELESMLLDRELAEETAEGYKADLDAVRARNEELSLELEVLKDENSELGREMSPEEKNSAGWLQLERTNERLKEALLQLRDLASDREAELKEEIKALEAQSKELDSIKSQYEETREKLLHAEANESDLKQQLEVALGAEDMIEELTEQNHNLKDKIADLHGVIEDLENLREINDELEINHIETEKQLQEEIDFKDTLLLDRERTAKAQQAQLDQADYNISRFRALVQEMKDHLQDLQASKQISESEAAELSSRSRAMQELNVKLQDSAAKTQVKTIDLELRRLDAEQASEHLAIVQLFLPEAFQAERDSVLALLRFKRIAFKANLVQSFVKERIASYGTRGEEEEVFAACDALDKLTWIAGMADRLVKSVSSSTVDAFTQYGSALYELEVVERALNDFVDALRRDDLKESEMATRLGRSIEVMTHLSSLHLNDSLADHSDSLTMKTALLQSRLDSATSALTVVKGMYEAKLPSSSEDDEYDDENVSDSALILNRTKSIIEQARNAKVISGKTHRALVELQARHLTLEPSMTDSFDDAESVTASIAAYACKSGTELQILFGEEGRVEPFSASEVSAVLARCATNIFSVGGSEAGPYATLNSRLRDLTMLLGDLSTLPTDLDNTVEFERAPAPWIARADEIRRHKESNMDMEAELARAQEAIRDRDNIIKQKETELNVEAIKTETFEARLKEASKRSAKIAELERDVRDAKTAESKAKADLIRAQQDAQSEIERVRDEMSRMSEERRKGGALKDVDGNAMGDNTRLTMKRQEYKIAGLEGAVRHLKSENIRLRLPAPDSPQAIKSSLDWLHEPMTNKSQPKSRCRLSHREGEKVFEDMLTLATKPPSIDLSKLPQNKLAWRPAKETSRWKIESRHEEWADWKHRREEILNKAFNTPRIVAG